MLSAAEDIFKLHRFQTVVFAPERLGATGQIAGDTDFRPIFSGRNRLGRELGIGSDGADNRHHRRPCPLTDARAKSNASASFKRWNSRTRRTIGGGVSGRV